MKVWFSVMVGMLISMFVIVVLIVLENIVLVLRFVL